MSAEMISIAQAAERLSCNQKTIRRGIERGSIKIYRLGNLIRIDWNELIESMEQG